ncbi:hypothetical protein VPH35_114133 [Triticum aestivum]
MARIWMGEETEERMNLGLTRTLVILSFVAHLTLALLAGIRRCRDSGVRRFLVWSAYHVAEIGTPITLGKVFLDTATADSEQQLFAAYREQQMFAFWAPFLLLHLGRPDIITSYALENKRLSPSHIVGLILPIGGAIYGSYKQRFMHGDGALRASFFIMLVFGSYKYVERAVALHRASFDNIRRSNERKMLKQFSFEDEGCKRDNDDALLDAHRLLGVAMGAFSEYEVRNGGSQRSYSGWKYVSKVVEMEASLMYDLLYTKASVIHTWAGYIIRVLSPPAAATALYLYHSRDGQALESADRTVTYILLVGTLALDVIWLLRALGSTWTYVFLVDGKQGQEEEIRLVCNRRRNLWGNSRLLGRLKKACRRVASQSWYWPRRLLVSLDPFRLAQRSGPSGHRLLPDSGVGQCNLLQECSTSPEGRLESMVSYFSAGPEKKIDIKDELLEAMCTHVLLEPGTRAGRRPIKELDDYMGSNREHYSFESNLIAFHLATNIFLLCKPTWIESEASAKYEKQIRALSDYMMFLLAQRKHMVLKPGDESSDYKKCRNDLTEIWCLRGTDGSPTTRATRLANTLLFMDVTHGSNRKSSLLSNRNKTLALGTYWALKLLRELGASVRDDMRSQHIQKLEDFILVFTDEAQTNIKLYKDRGEHPELLNYMLQLILASWMRFLIFTSNQCSSQSHAKQLSCGGELLTIVWLMNQHRTIFSIFDLKKRGGTNWYHSRYIEVTRAILVTKQTQYPRRPIVCLSWLFLGW